MYLSLNVFAIVSACFTEPSGCFEYSTTWAVVLAGVARVKTDLGEIAETVARNSEMRIQVT